MRTERDATELEAIRERKGRPGATSRAHVVTFEGGARRRRDDRVATEEPLEIRVHHGETSRTAAVTMRTPGHDFELAAGWSFTEGFVADAGELTKMAYCVDRDIGEEQRYNIVNVYLGSSAAFETPTLDRHFLTTSACGVCGSASIKNLQVRAAPVSHGPVLAPELICSLPDKLRAAQGVFDTTGGLHAAALFDASGELVAAREDVGRHNALDKLIGRALLDDRVPLEDHVVLVSGRASYELAQKCAVAGVPVLCAVSAPSSLAIQVAEAFDMTLIGFVRDERFNVYAGAGRLERP